MAILSTLLTNTPSAISPASVVVNGQLKDVAVTVIFFCNLNTIIPADPSAGKQYIDIHVVPDAGSTSATNQIVKQLPIDAGDTFTFSAERLVLTPGDQVFASTTNAGQVSATISYVVI